MSHMRSQHVTHQFYGFISKAAKGQIIKNLSNLQEM